MKESSKQGLEELGKSLKPRKWTKQEAKEHSDKVKRYLEGKGDYK